MNTFCDEAMKFAAKSFFAVVIESDLDGKKKPFLAGGAYRKVLTKIRVESWLKEGLQFMKKSCYDCVQTSRIAQRESL
jgi:hypothetical protein